MFSCKFVFLSPNLVTPITLSQLQTNFRCSFHSAPCVNIKPKFHLLIYIYDLKLNNYYNLKSVPCSCMISLITSKLVRSESSSRANAVRTKVGSDITTAKCLPI